MSAPEGWNPEPFTVDTLIGALADMSAQGRGGYVVTVVIEADGRCLTSRDAVALGIDEASRVVTVLDDASERIVRDDGEWESDEDGNRRSKPQ